MKNRRLTLCAFSVATLLEATIAALFLNALLNIDSFQHMNFGNLTYYADVNFMLEISSTCLAVAVLLVCSLALSPSNQALWFLACIIPFLLPLTFYWPEISNGNLYRYFFEIDAVLRIRFWLKLIAIPTFIISMTLVMKAKALSAY